MRDLADVSMNLQPNDRARASPSAGGQRTAADRGEQAPGVRGDKGRTLFCDFSLALEVARVADHHHGEVVLVLDPEDLLLERGDLLEALSRRDGVYEQESLACAHVLFPHGRIFLLAGRVQHVEQGDLVVDDALLPVGV